MSLLLSFLGGAAQGFTSEVEKAEKSAKEEAMLRVKNMYATYEKVKEDNLSLTNSLKSEAKWIETYYPTATPEQVLYLQGNPAALQGLKKMADPTKIDLSTAINIASTGGKANSSIIEDIQAAPAVMDKVAAAVKGAAATPAYRSGLGGMFDRIGEGAGDTAANRYARMLGTDVQTMEALKPLQRPTQEGTFDATVLRPEKGFTEQVDEAKKLMLEAQKSGDPKLIQAATVVATSIKKTNDSFSAEEKQYAKKLDDAKNVLLDPTKFTPEQVKEANSVYNNYIAIERRKAVGTKVSDPKDDSPKIGALNSFVSGAVSKELIGAFGKQVSEGKLTFTPNATGEVTANVLMTDMGERFNVATVQYEAAQRALSIFSDKNGVPVSNDGKAVLGQYKAALDRAREQYVATPEGKAKLTPAEAAPPPPPPGTPSKPAPATAVQQTQPVAPAKPAQPIADINKERALAAAAIKAQPQNAAQIKESFKARTKQDY
jgi:hypothetical protein